MNEEARKPRNIDLSSVKPTGVSHMPPKAAVQEITEEQGFTSREGKPSQKETPPPDTKAAPGATLKRRPGARKKHRNEAFNTRLKTETMADIISICDERDWTYADFVERALKAFKKEQGI